MNSSAFAAIQTVSTLALAASVEQFAAHNVWVALATGLLGIIGYVVYELVPQKS